jgi:quercetin dioxygenase-like cupin family protein
MGGIVVIKDAANPWQEPPAQWAGKVGEGEPSLRFKRLMPSESGRPNMQRTQYEPHHHEPPHSHPEDEVLFVLAGTVNFGREELTAGDSLFIPRDTRYSLRTGETGVEFLRVGFSDLAPPHDREDHPA